MTRERTQVERIGEFNLIERIKKILPAAKSAGVLMGIGDDTAVIRLDERRALLLTCDIQVESRHFHLDYITPYQLGRRAMAVNLSDIAAMGGTPTYGLVSLGLPDHFSVSAYDHLFEGMRDELGRFGAQIVGGNLARTRDTLVVDITLLGEIETSQILLRNGARPGHRIFLTGVLGASAAGFQILQLSGKKFPEKYRQLVECHLVPDPRLETGQRLSRAGIVSAMIDVSDGVASDLYHICTQSKTGAEIYASHLPFPRYIEEISEKSGKPVMDLALHSGEDYELLFTAPPEITLENVREIIGEDGPAVSEIGRIVDRRTGYTLIDSSGNRVPLSPQGWDHFRKQ